MTMRDDEAADDAARSDALVRRAKDGDRAAFDALIRRSQPALLRLVRARLRGDQRAELGAESHDLVQSALGEAVRHLDRFEYCGEGSFLRWLTTIAHNKLRHEVRDRHRARRDVGREEPLDAGTSVGASGGPPARDPSPSMAAAGHELEERYRRELESLDPQDQELLLLHLELGCTHAEIAAALSITSPEAVRKRIARALALLERRMLGGG